MQDSAVLNALFLQPGILSRFACGRGNMKLVKPAQYLDFFMGKAEFDRLLFNLWLRHWPGQFALAHSGVGVCMRDLHPFHGAHRTTSGEPERT